MWSSPYFTPALLNLNVHPMYGQENIQRWRMKMRRMMSMVVNVYFLRFLPFAPGKWGEMISLFHPFSCPITRQKKNIPNWGKGGEDISTPEIRSQIGGYIARYINNHGLRFKNGSTMILFSNSSPTRLLLKLPTVYRPILQFSPNCMDLKLVKSEDRAQ